MSLSQFRTYQLSKQFYAQVTGFRGPAHLKSQLLRAASSVALNLAEGSGKDSSRDQGRFYRIALGSLRECQAVFDLCASESSILVQQADQLGAHIWRLCQSCEKKK